MIYKKFQDMELSALGLGVMRMPVLDGDNTKIDECTAEEMFDYAMEHGINYYDTAWMYHGGESERVIGKLFRKYPRDKYYLASKFPGFEKENLGKVKEIFEKQLEKCGVEYFDFYLFHDVSEHDIDAYLNPEYGILEYLLEQKKNGRIRHLGFSTHGSLATMRRFLDAYGKHMEFCQIQLNWLDWSLQNAKAKVELVKSYGLPVWVMEPVRGGKLAALTAEREAKLREMREESIPTWAFRFLQGIDGVTVTLSGMSNMEQLRENIRTFEEEKALNEQERNTLLSMAEEMIKEIAYPCTACRYCTAGCPMQLDIPALLAMFNKHAFPEDGVAQPLQFEKFDEDKRPSACVGCRNCEEVCPQGIKISEAMAEFAKKE